MGEDCLQANVFTSERCLKKNDCPALVYLFPSDFYFGSSVMIEARRIAKDWASEDLVVVTFNHRLGLFGLLNLGTETSTDASNDAALLDQVEALKWTQKHLSKFGGDTRHVTLMSVGSGAANADLLALTSKTKGLFQQLVLIDGAAGLYNNTDRETNEKSSKNIAVKVGCATLASWGKKDKADTTLKCLREHRAGNLLDIQRQLEDYLERVPFDGPPVNPNGVLTKKIFELQEIRRSLPILLGSTGRLQSNRKERKSSKDEEANYCAQAANFKNLYLSRKLIKACKKNYKDQEEAYDEVTVNLPLLETSRRNTEQGGKTYLFETKSEFDENLHLTSKDENEKLKSMILRFIRTGDPSDENDKTQWEPFNVENGNYLKLKGTDAENTKGYHKEADEFWNDKSFETMPEKEDEEKEKKREDEEKDKDEEKEKEKEREKEAEEEKKKREEKEREEERKSGGDEKWKVRNMTKEEVVEFVDDMQKEIKHLRDRLKSDEEGFSGWKTEVDKTLKKLNEQMHHLKEHKPKSSTTWRQKERTPRKHREPHFTGKDDEGKSGRWKVNRGKWIEVKGKERDHVLRQVEEIERELEDIFDEFGIETQGFGRDYGVRNANPTLLPGGNGSVPTVPSVVVYRDAGWNLWFWIVFSLFVILLIVLMVTCFFLVTNKQKKGEYSQIS
ncbi:hypothetical protein L596_014813 [Steinernema carpocapsae]|uniref:Carboxylesterase type B domain-containing protein n=1 Tax=Steinernema carpocapsae TaxID=34508 RepID=A0A4V6A2V8_STECR|nr:hypothetical protein L596_014813 [Steinernema carpocapsae]